MRGRALGASWEGETQSLLGGGEGGVSGRAYKGE